MKKIRIGPLQQKIILALAGGVALGFSGSPSRYFRTLRQIQKEWRKIDQRNFNRSINRLSKDKLIEGKMLADGSFKLILTEKGKKQAKILNFHSQSINFKKLKKWDGKWRIVLFDIPEKDRLFREILREHLYALKFFKLQHSVFVSPYPFEKEILKLVGLYSAGKYVRVVIAVNIDNENNIKEHFSSFIKRAV